MSREETWANPEDAFPPEVLRLRQERGIPLPTWYSGPLYPPGGAEEAERAFAEWLKEREVDPDA